MDSSRTTLDAIGSFRPATHPEKRLPGRLTFDPGDGGRLEVVGSFHDPKDVIAKADKEADGSVGLFELLGLDSPAMHSPHCIEPYRDATCRVRYRESSC